MKLCRKAWRVVHRLFPDEFAKDVPNPWLGVTLESRVKKAKPAVTRDEVYDFAHGCIATGEPEIAAVAVICFEWLQRPENVIAGYIKWSDYRAPSAPTIIRVAHHKTGTVAPHPLEETLPDGTALKFYADAEEVLAAVPRRGVSMILREVSKGVAKPFAFPTMQHKVQRMRKKLGLPAHFTMDACRHGGMTELEEAELTDGQGRALSTHRTQQSYEGYAKRTAKRMLSATRKRHAHRLAEQNEPGGFRSEWGTGKRSEWHPRTKQDFSLVSIGWRRSADRTGLHANSLQTGNITGNFAISGLQGAAIEAGDDCAAATFGRFPYSN